LHVAWKSTIGYFFITQTLVCEAYLQNQSLFNLLSDYSSESPIALYESSVFTTIRVWDGSLRYPLLSKVSTCPEYHIHQWKG